MRAIAGEYFKSDGDALTLGGARPMQIDEGREQVLPAPAAARIVPHHLVRRRRRQRLAVGPVARQGVEHVDDADDLRQQRDAIAGQSVWIAAAVEPLMMMADDRAHRVEGPNRAAEIVAD